MLQRTDNVLFYFIKITYSFLVTFKLFMVFIEVDGGSLLHDTLALLFG